MASHCQRHILWVDTITIIADLNQPKPTLFNINADMGGVGIDGVFDQFFDNGCRACDHLASGDLIDE